MSDSELRMFKAMANPEKVDFKKRTFSEIVQNTTYEEPSVHSAAQSGVHSTVHSVPAVVYSTVPDDVYSDVQSQKSTSPPRLSPSRFSPPPPVQKEEVQKEISNEIAHEKQGFLFELLKMQQQGVTLTRNYTMNDSLEDIQFEYDRQRQIQSTLRGVGFMKKGLEMLFQGTEWANTKFGPILDLDGWSIDVGNDIRARKYDPVLERLYKKHWRKGSTSPEMELAWLVGSSMVMFHCKKKFMNYKPRYMDEAQPTTFAPSSEGKTPFNFAGMANPLSMMGNFMKPPSRPPAPPQQTYRPPVNHDRRPIMKPPVFPTQESQDYEIEEEDMFDMHETQVNAELVRRQKAASQESRQKIIETAEKKNAMSSINNEDDNRIVSMGSSKKKKGKKKNQHVNKLEVQSLSL